MQVAHTNLYKGDEKLNREVNQAKKIESKLVNDDEGVPVIILGVFQIRQLLCFSISGGSFPCVEILMNVHGNNLRWSRG